MGRVTGSGDASSGSVNSVDIGGLRTFPALANPIYEGSQVYAYAGTANVLDATQFPKAVTAPGFRKRYGVPIATDAGLYYRDQVQFASTPNSNYGIHHDPSGAVWLKGVAAFGRTYFLGGSGTSTSLYSVDSGGKIRTHALTIGAVKNLFFDGTRLVVVAGGGAVPYYGYSDVIKLATSTDGNAFTVAANSITISAFTDSDNFQGVHVVNNGSTFYFFITGNPGALLKTSDYLASAATTVLAAMSQFQYQSAYDGACNGSVFFKLAGTPLYSANMTSTAAPTHSGDLVNGMGEIIYGNITPFKNYTGTTWAALVVGTNPGDAGKLYLLKSTNNGAVWTSKLIDDSGVCAIGKGVNNSYTCGLGMLQSNGGATYVAVYKDGGYVKAKVSTDSGVTWADTLTNTVQGYRLAQFDNLAAATDAKLFTLVYVQGKFVYSNGTHFAVSVDGLTWTWYTYITEKHSASSALTTPITIGPCFHQVIETSGYIYFIGYGYENLVRANLALTTFEQYIPFTGATTATGLKIGGYRAVKHKSNGIIVMGCNSWNDHSTAVTPIDGVYTATAITDGDVISAVSTPIVDGAYSAPDYPYWRVK